MDGQTDIQMDEQRENTLSQTPFAAYNYLAINHIIIAPDKAIFFLLTIKYRHFFFFTTKTYAVSNR